MPLYDRTIPDYVGSRDASYRLVDTINAWWAERGYAANARVEQDDSAGTFGKPWAVRSDIGASGYPPRAH